MTYAPGAILAAVVAAALVACTAAETLRPLRRRIEPRLPRAARNFTAGGISLAVVTLLQTPILAPISGWTSRNGFGILNAMRLPAAAATIAGMLLLDYTLWHWHRINHRVPFFWRFHMVHHVDLDMDTTTGVRFHFGEMALSVAWRAVQIVLIGPSAAAIWIYQSLLFASVLFHHSNTRLPIGLERFLVRVIVTPRMHGIHHSDWKNETDSNWSSLLSVWDYIHRTAVLSVPQSRVEVGVPAYRRTEDVTLPRLLMMPFLRQRADWVRPDGAPRLVRPDVHETAAVLAP